MKIQDFLKRFSNVKKSGDGWTALCPGHEDNNNSLSVSVADEGKILVHCHAGCKTPEVVELAGLRMSDLFLPDDPKKGPRGCDLQAYAEAKRLNPRLLAEEFGLKDTSFSVDGAQVPAMMIPYLDRFQRLVGVRYRVDVHGRDRFRWRSGDRAGGLLYGMWRLDEIEAKGRVAIVEGESDCHTAWSHDVPALGVPGANNWRESCSEHLKDVPIIYLLVEPDKGGQTLLAALQGSSLRERVRVVDLMKLGFKDLSAMHADDPAQFKMRWEQAIANHVELPREAAPPLSRNEIPSSSRVPTPRIFGADELMGKKFPEPRWAIEGLMPEGLTVLGGKPKIGKSWFCLALGLSISTGAVALGQIPVQKGEVLYVAREDSERRLQERMSGMLSGSNPPKEFQFATEWPQLADDGLNLLADWLKAHTECRLVMIDTLQKVRKPAKGGANAYADDYAVLSPLKDLADAHRVAVLVVHHLRKMDADDPLDQFSGTTGLTGAADTLISLDRGKETVDATLYVRGRDVEEQALALRFDSSLMSWTIAGDASEFAKTNHRQRVVDLAKELGTVRASDVADRLSISKDAARQLLTRMSGKNEILRKSSGVYGPLEVESHTSQSHGSRSLKANDCDGVTGVTQAARVIPINLKAAMTLARLDLPLVGVCPFSLEDALELEERVYGTHFDEWDG